MTVSIHSLWRPHHARRAPAGGTARVVVVTGLDGALLDQETRSFHETTRALDLLDQRGIPLVLCSSRTRAETERLQEKLGVRAPFISENGGALFLPHGYFSCWPSNTRAPGYDVIEFGRPYHAVVAALGETARRLGIQVVGFSTMSIDEVATECDLTLVEARLAKLREHDEVFRILDGHPAVESRLFKALHRAGLRCSSRGRYHHVTGVRDQGHGLGVLLSLYRQAWGRVLTIGLSGSPCDVWLLQEVDIPIVVRNDADEGTARLLQRVPAARLTSGGGPRGWSEAIFEVVGPQSLNGTHTPAACDENG